MSTVFLADFTVFFVFSAVYFSPYFPFPAQHIYSFPVLEAAMNADLMVCFLAHQ